MSNIAVLLPLALTLAGAAIAAAGGRAAAGRRIPITRAAWLLAILPAAAFTCILAGLPALRDGGVLDLRIPWMPSLGLDAHFYVDCLSALFALLVSGIGTLVVIYTGYYFAGEDGGWRFLAYLFLFMAAMLGLVLAGDVITLWFFWEGTGITSFLLIAFKTGDEAARRGAFRSLFITGGGGIALLAGLLWLSLLAGGADYGTILGRGDLLRAHPHYLPLLVLILLGAFAKSAQVPAHSWLPRAMTAPTPASAYLHSATLVTAGVYLLARLNPALGNTNAWFWILSLFGLASMLAGAYLGLKQDDLKALLAYSTVSQLGVLVMLIGQDSSVAFKALVISLTAHALYKSALFLIVGIVDHETGTRDLRRLGGLARAMPLTLAVAAVAGLSMAGLPPLFGFLAKETLLATVTHPSVPGAVAVLFPAATVIAGALILAQAGVAVWDTFLARPRAPEVHGHEPPRAMLLAPALLAAVSLLLGLAPDPEPLARFFAEAAGRAYGGPVKVSLALWTGLTVPLALSVVAVSLGGAIFLLRRPVRAWQARLDRGGPLTRPFEGTMAGIDRAAYLATRTQSGPLRRYLAVMLIGLAVLVVGWGRPPLPAALPRLSLADPLASLRLFTLILALAAAALSVFLRRDFMAILALGASGLSVAVMMVLEPAPDVALVQVVVDLLAVVILTLALANIPREQRARAAEFTFRQSRRGLIRDAVLAASAGLLMTLLCYTALASRPRVSAVTPYYDAGAKPLTGANDIVGAVVVDFRGFDTMLEIVVFGMAGLGVYMLLRYAARGEGGPRQAAEAARRAGERRPITGIAGAQTSPFIHALAYLLLPVTLVVAATQIMYGHDQAGDGFTAGVTVSLAIAFWYVVFGYHATRQRLPWLRPPLLVGAGLAVILADAGLAVGLGGSFFAHLDYGAMLGLRLPAGFGLTTSFFFEVAIFLTVLGGASATLGALGHPRDDPVE